MPEIIESWYILFIKELLTGLLFMGNNIYIYIYIYIYIREREREQGTKLIRQIGIFPWNDLFFWLLLTSFDLRRSSGEKFL